MLSCCHRVVFFWHSSKLMSNAKALAPRNHNGNDERKHPMTISQLPVIHTLVANQLARVDFRLSWRGSLSSSSFFLSVPCSLWSTPSLQDSDLVWFTFKSSTYNPFQTGPSDRPVEEPAGSDFEEGQTGELNTSREPLRPRLLLYYRHHLQNSCVCFFFQYPGSGGLSNANCSAALYPADLAGAASSSGPHYDSV